MTIKEIAKRAEVSSAAVSRYLNGGSLSEEKKERIRKVIEETNYIPSMSARTMRIGKSKQVGIIVPKINSESISRMVAGITKVLDQAEYSIILGNTDNLPEKEQKFLGLFRSAQLDGVILIATVMTQKHQELLKSLEVPVVVLGQLFPAYSCIYYDDFHAAYEISAELLKNNKKKIGYIGVTKKDRAVGLNRCRGFEKALEEAGKTWDQVVQEEAQFTVASGRACMKRLLEREKDIDSVFCATDSIAIGAMTWMKEQGIKIPQEVRITGVGHNLLSNVIEPPLTTVHYYYDIAGEEAANILLSLINGGSQPVKQMMLGYELMIRGTT